MLRSVFLLSLFASLLYAEWYDRVTVNGYFSFEYEKRMDSEANDEGDPNGSFDSDLLDLVVNVTPADNVRVAADLTWEHGSATEDGRGNVAVEYAFAEYTKNEALQFRAGKMFTAFGLYNEIHTAKPATVNFKEPLSTNKIHKIGGEVNYFPRWGTGLALLGHQKNLDYIVQLTNGYAELDGQDYNPYARDDNANKALTARLKVHAKASEIGFSVYHDTFVDYNGTTDTVLGNGEIRSYGVHLVHEIGDDITLQMEGVGGTLKYAQGDKIQRYSFSVMPVYELLDGLRLYYMYEFFDPDDKRDGDRVTINTLGVNFEVAENAFLKCEVYDVKSQDSNTKLNGNDYTEFRSAVVIGF